MEPEGSIWGLPEKKDLVLMNINCDVCIGKQARPDPSKI
jgi:hypothetical protein